MSYSVDIPPYREMSRERERELIRLAQDSSLNGEREEAIDELVSNNLRFVARVARRYHGPFEDLFQEGSRGLLHAIQKYDLRRDCRLLTYAAHWIGQYMQRWLVNNAPVRRLPEHQVVILRRVRKAQEQLRGDGKLSTLERLAAAVSTEKTPVTAEQLAELLAADRPGRSLDEPLEEGGKPYGVLVSGEAPRPDELVLDHGLDELLDQLNERERRVIQLCFYEGQTFESIGSALGVTHQRAHQIKKSVLRKLKVLYHEREGAAFLAPLFPFQF